MGDKVKTGIELHALHCLLVQPDRDECLYTILVDALELDSGYVFERRSYVNEFAKHRVVHR